MIEDEKIGLKLAESKTEKFWRDLKQKCEDAIDMANHDIEINTKIIELAQSKLQQTQ